MSGEYRKAYSDKTHFSVPADAHDYTDDPHEQNGNGIYNDYTVDLQPREYSPTFNICCFTFQNTRRTKFMLFGGLLALCVFVLVLIVIGSSGKQKTSPPQTQLTKEFGLIAYGPDVNGLIAFNPSRSYTYLPYVHRLETVMHDYATVPQYASHEVYRNCNKTTTYLPEGQVCRFTADLFGTKCQNPLLYGYGEGRPCVLLVLKMPVEVDPVPLNYTDGQNSDVRSKIHERASSEAVGISCEGKNQADKDHIIDDKHVGEVIDFNPPKGFPLYSFVARNHTGYLSPAVMVQFNTITTNADIHIKCTAWAENLKDQIFSTEFILRLD